MTHPDQLHPAHIAGEDFTEPAAGDYLEDVTGGHPDATHAVPVVAAEPLAVHWHRPRTFTTQQVPVPQSIAQGGAAVGADRVQLAGFNPARVRLLVRAIGGAVWVGRNQDETTPTTGWPLAVADGPLELDATHDVWATAAAAGVTVAVLAEYLDG